MNLVLFHPQDRVWSAFPSSCCVRSCAMPVNGMENRDNKDIPLPYGDDKDVIQPYVGYGPCGWPLGQDRTEDTAGSNLTMSTTFHEFST
jgi:hypothetical protein